MTSTFEAFYAGTAPRLLRYAYGLTGDMAEAQDFTQEAYARAWPRWKRLQQYDNPESWLRLVVSRMAVDRLRWLNVRRTKTPHDGQVVQPPNEEMMTLVAALKRLPMPQRRALVLHYFLDMPIADIAAETGTNVNTVKTWLARGRVNVAAELADVPPAKQDIQEVRGRARRRRNRTVASTIAAFFATATAAATAFFAVGNATPPTLRPDIVVPFAAPPRSTSTVLVDDDRAAALWHGIDQKAYIGLVDLRTGTQPWQPVELGRFDDSLFQLGVRDGVMLVMGVNDSAQADNLTLLAVEVNSGTVLWRQTLEKEGGPLLDPRASTPGTETIVFVEEATMSGIGRRTGQQVWTASSVPDSRYSTQDGDRFAMVQPDGVLRIIDSNTGRTISERSGLPKLELWRLMLLGDWLYMLGPDGLQRVPVTGSQPVSQLSADGKAEELMRCGKHACLSGRDYFAAFDGQSGKELWRRQTHTAGFVQATDTGIILSTAGIGPTDDWGRAPDDRQVIIDPDGRDITPRILGTRKAYWIDNKTLMFEREIDRAVATGPEIPARNVELSVYSLETREERSLGWERLLYGNCTGIPGSYVCAGKDGFVLFR